MLRMVGLGPVVWGFVVLAACAPPGALAQPNRVASETAAPPAAAPASAQSLGAVRPGNLVLPQFAVSSVAGPEGPAVGRIVEECLKLADVASVAAGGAVEGARAEDSKAQGIAIDAWAGAGVNYVLLGSADGRQGQFELYDVASRQRLFGQSYSGFDGDARRLAHRVTDDIMRALTGAPGIFSSQICALGATGRGQKEVFVLSPDGSGMRQLTSENSITATPCWGMNGTEIYFTSYRDNNPDLYGMTLGGRRFEISRRPGLNTAPSWSEPLRRIAVSLSKDGNSELYTMTRDGRDLRRLTNTPEADTAPAWSPDGSRIAFTSDRGGSPQIYVMPAAGGGEASRVSSGGYADSPTWSPDGTKIAYVARESGEFNVHVVDIVNGGPAKKVTGGQRDNRGPSWAPSSQHLVVSSNRGGRDQLYLLNVNTRRAHLIPHGSVPLTDPDWGPPLR